MFERNRIAFQGSNNRGALVLGGLLLLLLLAAFFIAIGIYTQLDAAARLERRLIDSELLLGDVLRIELDEETGLRGYAVTGQRFFLEPYEVASGQFDTTIGALQRSVAPLKSMQIDATIADIGSVHANWVTSVAKPLAANPHSADALTRQTLGKILIDQMRGDNDHARALLDERFAQSQTELRRRINETLFGSLATVLIFGCLGIVFVTSRAQMLATIDRGRSIAETLQGAFQTDLDALPAISIGTVYVSATEDAAVGGDLYDVRRMDDRLGLVIVADVSGKGVEAAVNTAFVKYSIRTLARVHTGPAAILAAFNTLFLETIKNPNLFVVAFVGIVDGPARTLTYASAGHSGAYLRSATGVRPLPATGAIVGLSRDFGYEETTVRVATGDSVLLATDGLTEARDAAGAVLEDDGAMALFATAPEDPQACANALAEAVRLRSGGRPADDLALVVMRFD